MFLISCNFLIPQKCYISFYRPFQYTWTMFSESKCLSSLSFPDLVSQCRGNKSKIAFTSMKKTIKDGKSKFWYLTMRYRLGFRFVFWLLLSPAARTPSIHCVCLFFFQWNSKMQYPLQSEPFDIQSIWGMLVV